MYRKANHFFHEWKENKRKKALLVTGARQIGKTLVLQMYPMDFEEFCIANGVQGNVFEYLKECFEEKKAVGDSVHRTMVELFRYYVVIGKMPAAAQTFVDSHDMGRAVAGDRGEAGYDSGLCER